MKYDAIIIGGGHNGLTAAAYLARARKRVLVLERRHVVGGAAVTMGPANTERWLREVSSSLPEDWRVPTRLADA